MPSLIFSPLLAALVGTTIGALLTYRLTRKNDKLKLTIDFHKEWNSYEMSKHRRSAYNCIRQFPDLNYNELTTADEQGSISVFIVLRFYQRMWQCFAHNNLHNQLAANLFYENFYWYYFISFNTSLKAVKDDWCAYEEMVNLKRKIREYTPELDHYIYEAKYTAKYEQYLQTKIEKSSDNLTFKGFTINGVGSFQISGEK